MDEEIVHRAAEMILFYWMASFRPFPGLNAGPFAAAISIVSPVCGLRPVQVARSRTLCIFFEIPSKMKQMCSGTLDFPRKISYTDKS